MRCTEQYADVYRPPHRYRSEAARAAALVRHRIEYAALLAALWRRPTSSKLEQAGDVLCGSEHPHPALHVEHGQLRALYPLWQL